MIIFLIIIGMILGLIVRLIRALAIILILTFVGALGGSCLGPAGATLVRSWVPLWSFRGVRSILFANEN